MVKRIKWTKERVLRFCERCNIEFEYPIGAPIGHFRRKYCYECRGIMKKKWYRDVYLPWYRGLSPKAKKKLSARKREIWDEWVSSNKARRRQIARASYHRNRHKYLKRMRKYRKEYYRRTGR